MMVQFFTSLAALGKEVIGDNDTAFEPIEEYYTCEVTDPELHFVYAPKGSKPLNVTKRVYLGPGDKCNPLDGNLKYFFSALRNRGTDAFWIKCIESLTKARAHAALQAIKEFREGLDQYNPECISEKGTEKFYRIRHKSDRKAFTLKQTPSRKNMESLGVISDAITIIPTYKGKPLLDIPAVNKWWRTEYKDADGSDFDIVTGQRCQAITLLSTLTPIDTNLVSFNADAFTFEGFTQMANYPMSKETQDQVNAGFLHIFKYDQAQCLKLVDNDRHMSIMEVGWWAEGCVEHPLLALMGPIVRGGAGATKEVVAKAWEDLKVLEVDQTLIRFAAWQRAKRRFALLETYTVTAKDLKDNMLLWHEEWESCEHHPVGPTICQEVIKDHTVLPTTLLLPVFKAVMTGSVYSDLLPRHFIQNKKRWEGDDTKIWVNKNGHIWFFSHFDRKHNSGMARNKRFNKAKTVYDIYADPPDLQTFISESVNALQGHKAALSAYIFGVLLALNSRIMQLYKWHMEKRVVSTGDVLKQCAVPSQYYRKYAAKFAMQRERLRTTRPSTAFENIDTNLSKLEAGISAEVLIRPQANLAVYTNLGWNHGNTYVLELKSYVQQMTLHKEAGDKPKHVPNDADKEELDCED